MNWTRTFLLESYWLPSIMLVLSLLGALIYFWVGTPVMVFCGCAWLVGAFINILSIRLTSQMYATKAEIEQIERESSALRLKVESRHRNRRG